MSTKKKFSNDVGDLEEKPVAAPRALSAKRAEEIKFGTFDQGDGDETSAPVEGQVFSSEDETEAGTPTRKLHFDVDKPTRVWNFLLPQLSYEERRQVREARTTSEVKRTGRNDLSILERMALELDEVFNSEENMVVRTLLRPRVIDIGPTKPFMADFPDFDVDQVLTANEILKAYTWMKTTLKYCGYVTHHPLREDFSVCMNEYRKDPLHQNRILLETMQLSYNYASQLSSHKTSQKSEVPLSAKSLTEKKSKLTPTKYKYSPVISDPPGDPADPATPAKSAKSAKSTKSRKSSSKKSKGQALRDDPPKSRMVYESESSSSDDSQSDDSDEFVGSGDDDMASMPSRSGTFSAVNVMSVDTLPVFQGDEVGREAAYHWIQRFELLADTSRWNEKAKITWFTSYLGKSVRGWYNQLSSKHKVSWRAIKRKFNKEYITNPLSKSDKYHYLAQNPGEQLKAFFYRFNNAAIQANVPYWKNKDALDDHIGRFCTALLDEALGERLSQMSFASIGALERYLDAQRKNAALRQLKNRYSNHEYQGPRDPLRPSRGMPSAKIDADRRHRDREPEKRERPRHQVHVAMEDSDYDSPPPTKNEYEIFTMGGKKEWCSNCNSEHYRLNGECWKDIYCSICKRNGHPVARCHKACQLCDPPHNKYDVCESREQIVQAKAFLDALARSGRDDVPSLDRLNC